jgi:hypothetical protein
VASVQVASSFWDQSPLDFPQTVSSGNLRLNVSNYPDTIQFGSSVLVASASGSLPVMARLLAFVSSATLAAGISLTKDNFEAEVFGGKNAFVKFQAPW